MDPMTTKIIWTCVVLAAFAAGLFIGARVALWTRARGEHDAEKVSIEVTADTSQAVEALEALEQRVERVRKATSTFQGPGWWMTTTTTTYAPSEDAITEHGLDSQITGIPVDTATQEDEHAAEPEEQALVDEKPLDE